MEPVSLVHPAAPVATKPTGEAPRYLVRGDGVVLDYNPYLARLPGFTPADALPPAHLAQIAAARERDAALTRALAALQPVAEKATVAAVPAHPASPVVRGATAAAHVVHGAVVAPAVKHGARVAVPVPAHAPVATGPHEAEAIAKARFRAQLKPVFERAGLAMDLRKPMETLRAEALATLKAAPAPAAAAQAAPGVATTATAALAAEAKGA